MREQGSSGAAGGTRRIARCLLVAAALVLAGCQRGVLDPQGPVGAAQRTMLLNATAIMLGVIVPVIAATLIFAFWFRASNVHARYRPDFAYSGRLELLVWSIPALTVMFLGGIGWIGSHDLDPPKALASPVEPLEIEVVSLDWTWLFLYPKQNIASVNRLVVPAGTPLSFKLTSASVMNSFFVPQFGSQIYTMAGMTTRLNLMADEPGTYPGLSAQFSGDGFSDMRFDVAAERKDAFDAWVKTARDSGETLDEARFLALARPQAGLAPVTFRAVAPDLFQRIVDGEAKAPPGTPRTGDDHIHSAPRQEN